MRNSIIFIGILSVLWLAAPVTFAQSRRQASLERESLEYFNKQEYSKALKSYRQLVGSFPRDPWYNYYTGVCLTELKQEPSQAIYRLKVASLGKDIPADVYFYLGKASYQADLYGEAIDYFNRFRKLAGASESKSYHVDKWITRCHMYMNSTTDVRKTDNLAETQGKNDDYQEVAGKALEFQHKADSVRLLIYQKENRMRSATDDDRIRIQQDLTRLNEQAESFQQKADAYFVLAREYEKSGNMNPSVTARNYQSKPAATKVLPPNVRLSGEGPSPFLELTGDDFYRQPAFRKIFSPEDVRTLDTYHALNLQGNQYMKDALLIEREISRQQMIINTSTSNKIRKKAQQKIDKLEEQKIQNRLKAVGFFQKANDGEYAMNKKYIESFERHSSLDNARRKQGEIYKNEAAVSYNRALILRKKAANFLNYGNKYALLMESNAYELAALDDQRKAIATYAGLITASAETDLVHASVASPTPKQVTVPKKHVSIPAPAEQPPGKTAKKGVPVPSGNRNSVERVVTAKTPAMVDEKAQREKILGDYVFGFEMADHTVYPATKDIPTVNAMPPGVNYRIQVGVFKTPPPVTYFKGMYPMVVEKIQGKNLVRFYTGLFRTYGEASAVLLKLRHKGFKDAIIVGFYNGKRASVSRLQWLEDQEPYTNIHPVAEAKITESAASVKKIETLSLHKEKDVLFRVQLGVFSDPLPQEKLKELEKFAEKGYVVIRSRNNQGLYVYTFGNFTTFDQAKTFRNKLAEMGVSGCFVTAYKKGIRIPLSEIKGI